MLGPDHLHTLSRANNLANVLLNELRDFSDSHMEETVAERFSEAASLMRETLQRAERKFGNKHEYVLMMEMNYNSALLGLAKNEKDMRDVLARLESLEQRFRQVLGAAHPHTRCARGQADKARMIIAEWSAST